MVMNKEQFNNDMNALSNAINEKTGGTEPMTISEMVNAVKSISSGGGSSVEACTVTITYSFSPGASSNTITYTTPGMTSKTLTIDPDQTYTIQCAKNTIMTFGDIGSYRSEGDLIGLGRSSSFLVTGDGTIEME